MVDITSFRRAIDLEIERKMTIPAQRAIKDAAAAAYIFIAEAWPKFTYYSAANNRISITGRTINKVEPSQRPKEQGALIGKFESILSSELQKLERVVGTPRDRTIILGNAVSYAPDVGNQPGQGVAIYQTAAGVARSHLVGGD